MIRIMIYKVLDGIVATAETDHHKPDKHWPTSAHWDSLAYVKGQDIAHDEDTLIIELVKDVIDHAHRHVSERGGWSALI